MGYECQSIFFLFFLVWLVDWSFETQLRLALNFVLRMILNSWFACFHFPVLGLQVDTTVPGSMFLSVSIHIYILFLLCDCKNLPGGNSFLLLVHFPESLYYNDKVWQPWSQAFSFYVLALLLNSIQPQSSCFISVYFLVCKAGMIRTLA